MSKFHAHLLVVVLITLYCHASGWIPALLLRAVPNHSYTVRRSTALLLTPREIERMSGGSGDEDDGQAEEAARAAREALERMWSSSSKDSNEYPEDQLDNDANSERLPELPELAGELEEDGAQGMEVRRESPFPSSSERGALEAAAASQKAVVAGKRGLVIDIEVKQLDDEHREFEPDIMIHFITEVGKSLAAVIGKTKIMLRGDQLASTAAETLRRENMEAAEAGIGPREDISFCSMRTSDLDDEGDPDSMEEFAAMVARQMGEEERLVMIVGPRSNADVIVLREVVKAARGRPVVLVNPRMTFMPRETSEYDTVYLLRQFNVQPIKTDPRKAARRSPFKITSRQRRQQAIFSELGQMVPKVLTTRAFPDDFKLYVDIDGKGFRLEDTYDEKPHPSVVCFKAQTIIEEAQRQMKMEAQMAAVSDKQREMLAMWEEEEEDDDDDDDDDVIVPKRLTNDEIDARLRD